MFNSKSEVVGITFIQRNNTSVHAYIRGHYAISLKSLEFPTFPTLR